ncbi:MAG TPA: peptidyl-prolyl cis-trans isomerase [Pyrinomonadaceae bacterium]
MKFNLLARAVFAALLLVFVAAPVARAQEEEGTAIVLDEPVVQVNNDVVMLSQLRREMKSFKEALKARGMGEPEAEAELAKRQPEIIFSLITEALLIQKGKDIGGLSDRIEAEVNREMLRVCKGQNLPTLERCEEAMRGEGITPEEIRQTLRAQFTKQAVFQQEVDAKIYYGFTDAELQKYHAEHRDKFQSVTLSEIFLSTAGRKPEEVGAKAAQLVAQARAGGDFGALAEANSEREVNGERVSKKTKGRIEDNGKPRWFLVSDLASVSQKIADAIKPLKANQITDAVQTDEGFVIYKVHERDDVYNENQVRNEMLRDGGRLDKERVAYIASLRKEAYIKPADNYKEVLQPFLDKDQPATVSKDSGDKNSKDKKPQKQ